MAVCGEPRCVALPVENSKYCVIHDTNVRRQSEHAPIHCYACGELIRVGAAFVVRDEGAFHARFVCLGADPDTYVTKIMEATPGGVL